MATENMESTILHEHHSIVIFRHILAVINFIAILAGTLITSYFVQIRGIANNVLLCIRLMIIINIIQIALCITDFVLKIFFGRYHKWLVTTSYLVGVVWVIIAGLELLLSSLALGDIRIDLAAIAIIQLVTGIIAYVVWPSLDHQSIQKLTSPKVRDDDRKKKKFARKSKIRYVAICLLVAMLQCGALLSYKLPPKVYDLFSESRAIEYRLTSDGEGYEVVGLYLATSDYVNIPAYYNNKPVVKILKGAIDDTSLLEINKIKKIDIGTLTTDENGNEFWDSKLSVIEEGAIVNNNIETISIPESVALIQDGAISSTSLKNVSYRAKADFSYSYLNCPSLNSITIEGEDVGNILSLAGIPDNLIINVNKDIYNTYREKNPQYMSSLRPILPDDEFVVDFYTNSDYYIESIFCKVGEQVTLGYQDLKNDNYVEKIAPSVDTLAYINNRHETGTNGAKPNSAFRGWYLDKSLTQECSFTKNSTVSFNASASIYAKWIDEYKATLNWGTFMPENQPTEMFWTKEDGVTFPVIADRVGYSAGVQWYFDGTTNQVLNSQGVTKDVTLNGIWVLDVPVIDINPRAMVSSDPSFNIATDKNAVGYTYDETQKVFMDAVMNHPLQGTSYNNLNFGYSTIWTKVNNSSYSRTESTISLENVPESGEYILTVTALSPYGEFSTSETRINVNIAKKAIEMGTVELFGKTVEYTSDNQTVAFVGEIAEPRVKTTYNYYDSEGELVSTNKGVKNVGTYTVKTLFQKSDSIEAQNYETKELTVELVVEPHQLTFVSWQGGDYTYNSAEQKVSLEVSGVYSNDKVNVLYEGNAQTNVGQYVAKAIGVDNNNYSISDIDKQNNCTFSWSISPKEVTVKEWKLDGSVTSSFSIVYNGEEHVLEAVMDGVYTADVGNVSFTYDETANKTVAKNANIYTAKIVGVDSDNYVLVGESSQQWEITKKPIQVLFDSYEELIYNSKAQGVNAYVSGVCTSDVGLVNNESFVYEGKSTDVNVGAPIVNGNDIIIPFTSINVKEYTATISAINTASSINLNYTLNITEPVTTTFEIKPKDLYVYNNSTYQYKGENQKLSLQVYGFTSEDLNNVALEQFTTENVVEGYVDGEYFTLALYGKDVGDYPVKVTAFENSNYSLNGFDNSISIHSKRLTTTWHITNNATNSTTQLYYGNYFEYNFSGYTVFATVDGLVNDETVELTYQQCEGVNVGRVESSLELPSSYSNYSLDSSYIEWEIIPYALDFSWTFNGTEWADDGIPTFEYSASYVEVQPVFTPLGNDEVQVVYDSYYSDIKEKDANSYNVIISGLSNSNYEIGENYGINWKITPKTVKVTWYDTDTITYNAQYAGPSFSLEGLLETGRMVKTSVNSTSVYFNVDSVDSKTKYNFVSKNSIIDAGTYTCAVNRIYVDSYTADNNYSIQGDSCSYKINKAKVQLGNWSYSNNSGSASAYTSTTNLIYNSKQYALTNVIESGLLYRDSVIDSVGLTYSQNKSYYVGNYTATATLTGEHAGNYDIEGSNTCDWSIQKKAIAVIWEANDFTYNRGYQYQYANVTYGATGDDDLKVYDSDYVYLEYNNNNAINAGTYTAKVTGVSNNNYYCVDNCIEKVWTIKPKTVNVSWYDTSLTYSGYNQYPYAYLSEATLGYEYTTEEDSKYVGSYVISIESISNPNYIVSESSKTTTYTINPLIVNFNWIFNGNSSADSYTYDGKTRTVSAEVSNRKGDDIIGITYAQSDLTVKNANTYQFNITAIDNENYIIDLSNSSNISKSITVYPKTIEFSWGYGTNKADAQNFTYDGNEREITAYAINLESDDTVTIEYNGNRKLLNANSYSFAVSSISGEDAGNYSLSYSSTKSISISVYQQPVIVNWENTGYVTYDGENHEITATVEGSVDGKDIDFSYVGTRTFKDYGSYYTTIRLSDSNYYLDSYSNTSPYLYIEKAVATVTWTGEKVVEYDGLSHKPEVKVTGVLGEELMISITEGSTSYSNVGKKTRTVSLQNSNYKLPSDGSNKFEFEIVTKKLYVTWYVDDVEVTSETTSLVYDGNTHTLRAEVKDSKGNDYTSVLKNSFVKLTGAGVDYLDLEINNSNYEFTADSGLTSATLIIRPATIKVTWSQSTFTYDGTTHYVHATIVGSNGKTLVEGVDFVYTYNNYLTDVGSIEVTAVFKGDSYYNYTYDNMEGSTTVTLTVEANN